MLSRARAHRVVGMLAAGQAAAGVSAVFVKSFARSDPFKCSDGWDGFGCALATVALVVLAAFVVGVLTNVVLLRILRVPHAVAIGSLSVVTVVVVGNFMHQSGLNIPTLVSPIALANVGLEALLRRLPERVFVVPLLAVAVLASAVPLHEFGSRIGFHSYRAAQRDRIAHADFTTYLPDPTPAGYHIGSVGFSPRYPGSPPHSNVAVWFGQNMPNDPRPFELHSFRVPAYFDPPTNCGQDTPSDVSPRPWPCHLVGATSRGEAVWVDGSATFSNVQTFYVVRATTLVTLRSDVAPGLGVDWVVGVFNSLQPYK